MPDRLTGALLVISQSLWTTERHEVKEITVLVGCLFTFETIGLDTRSPFEQKCKQNALSFSLLAGGYTMVVIIRDVGR